MIPNKSIRQLAMAFCVLALVLSGQATAQQTVSKRPLTHDDYDSWRTIQSQRVSDDGRFVAYLLVPEDGDSELVVRNLSTSAEWRHVTGNRRAPAADDDEGG